MLSAGRLIHWARLHDRRVPGNGRWVLGAAAVLGAALAYELHRRGVASEQSRLWMIALLTTTCLAFVTAPFRIFWSRDADALARHPIRGRPLFRLGLTRNLWVAGGFALPSALGLAGFVSAGQYEVAIRHAAVAVAALAGTTLLAPACAVLAGALAASERAEAVARSFGGEFQAPRGAYLGIIPGVVGACVVLVILASSSWAVSAEATVAPYALLATIAASAAAAAIADARADAVMPGAVRELGALNRRRLAHVETTTPTLVERLACSIISAKQRAVVRKDLSLLRRRHPAYNLLQAGSTITAWALALRWPHAIEWIAALAMLMHIYSVVMAWRATQSPIEEPRMAMALPVSAATLSASKRAPLHLRTLTISITMGSAMFYVASPMYATIVVVGSAFVATLSGSIVIARLRLAS